MSLIKVFTLNLTIITLLALGRVQGGDVVSRMSKVIVKSNLEQGYDMIDEWLSKNVDESEPAKANVDRISRYGITFMPRSRSDQKFAAAIVRFSELETAIYFCNIPSIEIFRDNIRHSKLRIETPPDKLRRIQKVVNDYLKAHARICEDVYPRKYEDYVRNLDQDKFEFVVSFVDKKIALYRDLLMRDDLLVEKVQFDSERDAELAIQSIRELGGDDPNLRFLGRVESLGTGQLDIQRAEVADLLFTYILSPCEHYTRRLAEVFLPFYFDQLSIRDERYRDDHRAFHAGSARFRLCKRLLDQDEEKLLNQLVVVLERQTTV